MSQFIIGKLRAAALRHMGSKQSKIKTCKGKFIKGIKINIIGKEHHSEDQLLRQLIDRLVGFGILLVSLNQKVFNFLLI